MFIKKLCFAIIVIMYIANKCKIIKLVFGKKENKENFINDLNYLFEKYLLNEDDKKLFTVCFIIIFIVLVAIDVLLFYGVGFFDILIQ